GGQVLKVDGDNKASVFFRTGELEVHALARDRAGNLYAGTSPGGKIFRIAPDGKGTEILSMDGGTASDAGAKFVLSIPLPDNGTVFPGTGPEGKVYRISPGSKPEVLATIPTKAVMSLLLTPTGALYAGTAEGGSIYRIQPDGPTMLYDTDQDVISGLAMDGA